MPSIIHASPRLTHKYRDGWADEDDWGDSLRFKALAPRVTEYAEDFDRTNTTVRRVIGDKHGNQQQQAQALRDYFSGSNCQHEYDCCGCTSYSATVRKVKPGIFTVLVRGYRNY